MAGAGRIARAFGDADLAARLAAEATPPVIKAYHGSPSGEPGVRAVLDSLVDRLGPATPVVPAPNRWWLDPQGNPGPQAMIERALQRSGLTRDQMLSGAFLDPRTGEILDGRAYLGGAAIVDPSTGRPAMAVSGEYPTADWMSQQPSVGTFADTNLVRRSVGWEPIGEQVDLPFLATVESGKKHFYGRGVSFESPVLLRNIGGTDNPTLRPRARGSIFGENQVGEMILKGRTHPVYDILHVAPRGTPAPGDLLKYGLLAPAAAATTEQP
jgi:hypothetical protein